MCLHRLTRMAKAHTHTKKSSGTFFAQEISNKTVKYLKIIPKDSNTLLKKKERERERKIKVTIYPPSK